jgi:putative transposase
MDARPPHSRQLALRLPVPRTWGGRRRGAGRKRTADRPLTPHRTRPLHSGSHPVHVTLRARIRPLRSQHVLPTLRLAIDGANERAPDRFRITQYSVQYDHIHLFVEAVDQRELSRGMASVTIRIARRVNTLLMRRGRFWADRWYGRELTSPRQVRAALVYVLANFRKHSRRNLGPGIDPFSSGMWFDGWDGVHPGVARSHSVEASVERAPPDRDVGQDGYLFERDGGAEDVGCDAVRTAVIEPTFGPPSRCTREDSPVRYAETWLAREGWRRHGLLRLDEAPAGAPKTESAARSGTGRLRPRCAT